MCQVDIARVADRDATWSGQYREDGEELSIRRKFLHAVVVKVGDEDLVGRIDCNADRKVKFARFRAFAPPFRQEPGRSSGNVPRFSKTAPCSDQSQNIHIRSD